MGLQVERERCKTVETIAEFCQTIHICRSIKICRNDYVHVSVCLIVHGSQLFDCLALFVMGAIEIINFDDIKVNDEITKLDHLIYF